MTTPDPSAAGAAALAEAPAVAPNAAPPAPPRRRTLWSLLRQYVDRGETTNTFSDDDRTIDWVGTLPYIGMHVACLAVIWVGFSWPALILAVALYGIRMFGITACYHRYFSHKSYHTSRWFQFVLGWLGCTAVQRGPLWWAAHHRHHHRYSDQVEDLHSPKQSGFLWSHMGWFNAKGAYRTRFESVRELARFPELIFLDRFFLIPAVSLAVLIFAAGWIWSQVDPASGVTAGQFLVWGFFISTVALYHGTYTVNSLAHVWGSRRYETTDTSRNNPLLAILTLGEGWHNNHHHYQASARQGFYWWEIDLAYYGLKVLSWLGLVWDLKPVPEHVRSGRGGRGRSGDPMP